MTTTYCFTRKLPTPIRSEIPLQAGEIALNFEVPDDEDDAGKYRFIVSKDSLRRASPRWAAMFKEGGPWVENTLDEIPIEPCNPNALHVVLALAHGNRFEKAPEDLEVVSFTLSLFSAIRSSYWTSLEITSTDTCSSSSRRIAT